MIREYFYTESGEFWPLELPEIDVTSLEDIENERIVDLDEEDELVPRDGLGPEEELDFE